MSVGSTKMGAARSFCVLAGAWLTIRVVGVVAHGLSWELPGDGWRTMWQIAMVGVALAGALRPALAARAVGCYAAAYGGATLLELVHGADLLGLIPVDSLDRIIHPTVAVLALGALAAERRLTQRVPRRVPRSDV